MSASVTAKLQDDMNSIPLADDDPQVIIPEEEVLDNASHLSDALGRGRSMDSIPSTFTNGSCSPNSLDPDISPDEQEEKARLIAQVLELQNTLDGGCVAGRCNLLEVARTIEEKRTDAFNCYDNPRLSIYIFVTIIVKKFKVLLSRKFYFLHDVSRLLYTHISR
ncbi:uncharacterized protein LOC118448186 isoform X1 [Vespa mandarinia]|uniref:uncharacterized protein LOC118448186 isoform X1 n=1 Tax=Vespa mandarinia TaxID=7446 RepID=UPI0016089B0F|nr:uncharacterized protein LOC118448186 isoform X1 [Vespa mandarinia]XP_035737032.1 uncharacterized protein LOC118448186 isoform X1 [Vespa mandarinia]XP_035737033.1 uncharacterized protein LOC118448186 isoform X1 [Vespa mandarinia]